MAELCFLDVDNLAGMAQQRPMEWCNSGGAVPNPGYFREHLRLLRVEELAEQIVFRDRLQIVVLEASIQESFGL
jgi:hypothetical protein